MDKPSRERIQQMRQPSPSDPIKELAPEASKEVQSLLRQLKSREAEINRWFQEDPERLEGLRRDPHKTLEELLRTMRLERPRGVEWGEIRNWVFAPRLPEPPPVGSALLVAVWQFIAKSPNNLAQLMSDPFKVINDVAATTNASKAERDAVISAFETVTGRQHIPLNPSSVLRKLLEATVTPQAVTARHVGP